MKKFAVATLTTLATATTAFAGAVPLSVPEISVLEGAAAIAAIAAIVLFAWERREH